MPRVKRGVNPPMPATRRSSPRPRATGAVARTCFGVAKQAVIRAGQMAYRDRRQRKRQFRALWIVRINAGAREHGLSYSRLMNGLDKGRYRNRSQAPGRPGGLRQDRIRSDCRTGKGQLLRSFRFNGKLTMKGEGRTTFPLFSCEGCRNEPPCR